MTVASESQAPKKGREHDQGRPAELRRCPGTDLDVWRSYTAEVLGHEIAADSDAQALYLRMDEHHHRLLSSPAMSTTSRSSDGR